MKARHIIILPLAAAALLSCAKERVDKGEDGTDAGMRFATQVDMPRGAMLNTPVNLADKGGFSVWAIEHSDSWAATPAGSKTTIMGNLPVTSDDGGTTWSYGAAQDWPMDKRVSFFAYGPTDKATPITPAADGMPRINFAVNSDASLQTDLVIAAPMKDQAGAAYSYGNPVSIYFKHALARISFSGLLVDASDTREIIVKEIKLNGLYGSGTTPLSDPAVWTLSGSPTESYTVAISTGELEDVQLDNTGPRLTTEEGCLFLMPQPLARVTGDPTMDVTLEVDGAEVKYTSLVFSPNAWEPGKPYNYQLAVTKDDLRIIYIDSNVSLSDWSTSIVLQTIYFTSDEDRDAENIESAIDVLDLTNSLSTTHRYQYFGVYAVNDISHDIEIDISLLLPTPSYTSSPVQQHLLFDFKKLVRLWGLDAGNGDVPWKVKVINYSTHWDLAPSKQTVPASYDVVDAYSSATLPATLPTNGGGNVSVTPSNIIDAPGSIILRRKPIITP